MSHERLLVHMNAIDEEERRPSVPQSDPTRWAGQLETVESPYTQRSEGKLETGFRGRDVEVVSDATEES
jgi:hypothetical protein